MKNVFVLAVLFFSFSATAQKIVFQEPYDIKNNPFDSKLPAAKVLEDSITKNKLMIVSGGKDVTFYSMDPGWKLIKKFTKPFTGETVVKGNFFTIEKFVNTADKWIFIGSDYSNFTRETIDFAAQTHTVQAKLLPEQQGIVSHFMDGNAGKILYYTKDKQIKVASFSEDLKPVTVTLKIYTNLPTGKSSKYTNEDIYNVHQVLDSFWARSASHTRKKAHFYVLNDSYAWLLFGDEPLAELTLYDKKTGSKIKSKQFSVAELAKAKDYNTAGLLFEDKVYVLAAHKSGGVIAAFDTATGKMLYSKTYGEKDEPTIFNYGPVLYETSPGTVSTGVLKEKVDDIDMDKFCKEMFKHSCAITIRKTKYGPVVSLANHDQKELAGATSHLRSGMNTMTSSLWYVSASAGIMFEPGTLNVSKKKITWNELNKSEATGSYSKVKFPARSNEEYNEKKAYRFESDFINDRYYVIYYYEGQLKVDETILKSNAP